MRNESSFKVAGLLVLCGLLVSCGKGQSTVSNNETKTALASAGANVQGPPVPGSDPPTCDDRAAIKHVTDIYNSSESTLGHRTVSAVKDLRQVSYGKSPKSVNQYATSTEFGTNSRYCQATFSLSDNSAETGYWRMDYLKEGNNHNINYEFCSLKHDTYQDKCADFKFGQ